MQAQLGEVIAWRNAFWALSDAPWPRRRALERHGAPDAHFAGAYRVLNQEAMPKVKNIIEQIVASGLIYLNSHTADFKAAGDPRLPRQVRARLRRRQRGRARQVMKMLWDAIGTEFGSRHELYEINYIGSNDVTRLTNLWAAQGSRQPRPLQGIRAVGDGRLQPRRLDRPPTSSTPTTSLRRQAPARGLTARSPRHAADRSRPRRPAAEDRTAVQRTRVPRRDGPFATGVVVISTEIDGGAHRDDRQRLHVGLAWNPAGADLGGLHGAHARQDPPVAQVFGISMLAQTQLNGKQPFRRQTDAGSTPLRAVFELIAGGGRRLAAARC